MKMAAMWHHDSRPPRPKWPGLVPLGISLVKGVVDYVLMGRSTQAPKKKDSVTDRAVKQLRHEAAAKGAVLGQCTDLTLRYVLEKTNGDIDLAATALSMQPRPVWVQEFVGP